jgi:acyl-CoA thioester hydrolase
MAMPDQQSPMPPDFAAAMPVRGSFDAGWHVLPLRVYYEDTDAGGVVYHGRYLGFAERGRTEMMRAIGFDMGAIVASGVAIAVRHCAVDYRGPARLDDAIEVATRVTALAAAACRWNNRCDAAAQCWSKSS